MRLVAIMRLLSCAHIQNGASRAVRLTQQKKVRMSEASSLHQPFVTPRVLG